MFHFPEPVIKKKYVNMSKRDKQLHFIGQSRHRTANEVCSEEQLQDETSFKVEEEQLTINRSYRSNY